MAKPKTAYVVVKCMAGTLNFYKGDGLGMFNIYTGRLDEAARLPFEKALKHQDHRTFAVKESLVDQFVSTPPKNVQAILDRQKADIRPRHS